MPWSDGRSYRRDLPHWRREEAAYFVTWCLHRSQPRLSLVERDTVFGILPTDHGHRCRLIAAVVMDDHVHVLVKTYPGTTLDRLQHSWKSYSAYRLQRVHRRQGRIWQEEAWDRVVRDESELQREIRYIRLNPARRWPGLTDYPWLWVDLSSEI